jgi:hypothetical protein
MEDIGTKDGRAPARRVFVLNGVPNGIGVSTESAKNQSDACSGVNRKQITVADLTRRMLQFCYKLMTEA